MSNPLHFRHDEYLPTMECKRCGKTGKVRLIHIKRTSRAYVCDGCNWFYMERR